MKWNLENIQVIYDVINEKISKYQTARMLCLTPRTIENRVKRLLAQGESSFIHKNKDKPSRNKKDLGVVYKFVEKFSLQGCNFSYLSVLLEEELNFLISRHCLRNRFLEEGVLSSLCRRSTRKKMNKRLKKIQDNHTSKKTKLSQIQQILLNSFEDEELTGK